MQPRNEASGDIEKAYQEIWSMAWEHGMLFLPFPNACKGKQIEEYLIGVTCSLCGAAYLSKENNVHFEISKGDRSRSSELVCLEMRAGNPIPSLVSVEQGNTEEEPVVPIA